MSRYLVVVDMQNDFVEGALGTDEARKIIPSVIKRIRDFSGQVIYTKDTHGSDYLFTQEGRLLPVTHCVADTYGGQLIRELEQLQDKKPAQIQIYEKNTFASVEMAEALKREHKRQPIESVELIGVCTDICVVSNAILLKAYLPEVLISVDSSCCAGVTPQLHEAALQTMESCQIMIRR